MVSAKCLAGLAPLTCVNTTPEVAATSRNVTAVDAVSAGPRCAPAATARVTASKIPAITMRIVLETQYTLRVTPIRTGSFTLDAITRGRYTSPSFTFFPELQMSRRVMVLFVVLAVAISSTAWLSGQAGSTFQFIVVATNAAGEPVTDLKAEEVIMSEKAGKATVTKIEPFSLPVKVTI